jgi:hypothetical protein
MKECANIQCGWWIARFRIHWPEGKVPLWHIDLLLAHKIVAPLLNQYKDDIGLWRFHRRAARDKEGHQFSLLFRSSPETASRIFNSLKQDSLLKQMKRSKMIIQDIYDDLKNTARPGIEDTSDSHWSPFIMKSWPFFIRGVCEMWLSLINQICESRPLARTTSLKKIAAYYEGINEIVKEHWREEGGHSLLHHLNAIFGYDPVVVHEKNLRRF